MNILKTLLIGTLTLLSCSKQDSKLTLDVATSKLKLGMTTQEVVAVLGAPKTEQQLQGGKILSIYHVSNGDVVVFFNAAGGVETIQATSKAELSHP